VTTGVANTFGPLQSFTNGISAAGGVTFTGPANIRPQLIAWNIPIFGSTLGSIHIGGPTSATPDAGPAITFGTSDGGAEQPEAGIYINSDGTYGTRMRFATTDSYAIGPQLAMTIREDRIIDCPVGISASGNITLHGALVGSTSGTAPKYFARAWVNFNGTGTPAIRSSGNVSSITDGGVGEFEVNFTTTLPNANYAAVNGSNNYNQGQPCELSISYGAASAGQFTAGNTTPRLKTTSACRFTCGIGNSTSRIDPYEIHIAFYG
jgi:hypothetical protein